MIISAVHATAIRLQQRVYLTDVRHAVQETTNVQHIVTRYLMFGESFAVHAREVKLQQHVFLEDVQCAVQKTIDAQDIVIR